MICLATEQISGPRASVNSVHDTGGAGVFGDLSAFRQEFCRCLTARADAVFELADAVLCADGPVRSLPELSLVGEHRRGHGSVYAALDRGRIEVARLRRALAAVPLPRAADGRLVLCTRPSRSRILPSLRCTQRDDHLASPKPLPHPGTGPVRHRTRTSHADHRPLPLAAAKSPLGCVANGQIAPFPTSAREPGGTARSHGRPEVRCVRASRGV
ncbi:transposase [Nocardia sp. CWNU-33]|uniref:transposase n=1 Tax=Nocardia sp. CWNU-33 TaxID=3392117 RepID=UPI00398F3757